MSATDLILIRSVVVTDVPDVVAHVTTVLAEFGLTFGVGAETDDQLAGLPRSYAEHGGHFWVARDGERLLGTAGVFPIDSQTFELRKMYLVDAARGLGLGRRLLDEAERFVRESGATRLVLDTTEQMTRAISFYESHGFVRDDNQRRGSRCSRGYIRELG